MGGNLFLLLALSWHVVKVLGLIFVISWHQRMVGLRTSRSLLWIEERFHSSCDAALGSWRHNPVSLSRSDFIFVVDRDLRMHKNVLFQGGKISFTSHQFVSENFVVDRCHACRIVHRVVSLSKGLVLANFLFFHWQIGVCSPFLIQNSCLVRVSNR